VGPAEAAKAVELLAVRHVMPIHHGTFPLLSGTADELRAALRTRGLDQVTVHAPRPGESVS
jgi:L-ascorbate metabolism protein UlaG (beta-lactamase superfamily)